LTPRSQAVVFFSRSPQTEGRQKTFGFRDFRTARSIAEQFILRSLRTLDRLPADVFWSSDVPVPPALLRRHGIAGNLLQTGSNLRERLHDVFATLFDAGYERVTVVGNDTPLCRRDLLRALEAESDVFGPSRDGGFYLLTLHRDSNNFYLLDPTSWNGGKPRWPEALILSVKEDFDDRQSIIHLYPERRVVRLALSSDRPRSPEKSFTDFNAVHLVHPSSFRRPPPFKAAA
jgi:glycosyltransferase A (GT-A) superfamily protein (DUF2064 family)